MHTAVLRRLRVRAAWNWNLPSAKPEQTNSSVIYGDQLFLKFFRRLDVGVNPDSRSGIF